MTSTSLNAKIGGTPVEIDEETVRRYDRPLPRYTSFPPADRWGELSPEAHAASLARCAAEGPSLSLYFHVPFCDSKCAFCGCSSVATRNTRIKERYVGACLAELALVAGSSGGRPSLSGIHFGGGTPTSVGIGSLKKILGAAGEKFDLSSGAEVSIEIDPRCASVSDIGELRATGFTRVSFGVQDFDGEVGRLIGRASSFGEVRERVEAARAAGFGGINLDLVYGLPGQTRDGWEKTLELALRLSPDRMALFNFAYLPARLRHQRAIDPGLVPEPMEKLSLFAAAVERFESEGYAFIGLDHFAREGDPLARAHREGKLTRNFQGYAAGAGVPIAGVGATSISEMGSVYSQNEKKLIGYMRDAEAGIFPTRRGALLSPDEEICRRAIRSLMCSQRAGIISDEAFSRLLPLREDGIVEIAGDEVRLTPLGRLFSRHAASAFDPGLKPGRSPYSRAL